MPSDWKKFVTPEADPYRVPPRRRGLFYFGPRELGLRLNVDPAWGPEEFVKNNPQLFATGTTSRDEGYAYWALLKIIGEPEEIGKNGLIWYYQSKVGGGSNLPGGAIVDFVIDSVGPNPLKGIRVVTPHFHTETDPYKRASDEEQIFNLMNQNMLVVDVFSQNYIFDKTGRAVIKVMKNAINEQSDFGPNIRRWRS
jgi:hypothetical protein